VIILLFQLSILDSRRLEGKCEGKCEAKLEFLWGRWMQNKKTFNGGDGYFLELHNKMKYTKSNYVGIVGKRTQQNNTNNSDYNLSSYIL